MIVDGYEVEVEKAVRELRRLGARRVLIQSPLGLRKIAISLATELSASGSSLSSPTHPAGVRVI